MVKMTETASPMSSYSGLPSAAGGSGGGTVGNPSSYDDYSSDFSVVSSPPLASAVFVNGMGHFHDLQYDPSSSTSDLSFTQMQEAVHSLLEENAELKEVVQRDHATMKSQYEVMLHSKDQIEVFMSRQLEVRDMAKTAIERLKTENKELLDKIKAMEKAADQSEVDGHKVSPSELVPDHSLLAAKADELERSQILHHQLQAETRELRIDYNQLKIAYDRLMIEKRELATINFELQTKLCNAAYPSLVSVKSLDGSESSDDQNEFLVVERRQQRSAEKNSVVYLEGTSQTTMVDEKAIENLQAQLISEQERCQELTNQLIATRTKLDETCKQVTGQEDVIRRLVARGTSPSSTSPATSSSIRQIDSIESELKVSDEKAQLARAKLDKFRTKCDELDNWLGDHKPVVTEATKVAAAAEKARCQQLQSEVDNLRRALAEEQVQKAANKKLAFDAQKALETTQAELKNYKTTYEEQSIEQVSKKRQSEAYYCLQAKTFQEKHDALYVELVTNQEALAKMEGQLKVALDKLAQGSGPQRMPDDIETIAILTAQVELYKADFQAERESREKLHEEKEKILTQVKQLQLLVPGSKQKDGKHERTTTTRESKHDKDRHSRHERRSSRNAPQQEVDNEAQADEPGAEGGPAEPEVPVDEFPFKCPKCEQGFKEYTPLERHVNICLDQDNPFL